jgi:hypothetical protein
MKVLRNGILVLMVICVGLQFVACSTLAMNGDKRYKVELNNILLRVQSDFDKSGAVSGDTRKKLDDFLTKYEADYSSKASYTDAKKMRDLINEAEADPNTAFGKYQQALALKTSAEEYLTTEVKQ